MVQIRITNKWWDQNASRRATSPWLRLLHLWSSDSKSCTFRCMIYFVAQDTQSNGSGVLLQQIGCIIIAHKTQIENSPAWWVANNSTKITNLRPASWWNCYLSTIKISLFSLSKEDRASVEQKPPNEFTNNTHRFTAKIMDELTTKISHGTKQVIV